MQGASISKRSVSALARTSQLPHSSTGSSDQGGLGGLGHDQEHGAQHPDQHKRSELQDEAIREELLRQRAAPVSEALLSAIMAADQYGYDNGIEEKRSLSSLARYGNLPAPADEKRSLSSLARYGNLPAPADEKRSLSSLARVGNFPISKDDDEKRSLASLARYGNLPTQADEIKRSLTSIARLGGLPSTGKRSLEALARGGLLNKNTRVDASKRSVSALARAGELPGKRFIPDQQREQAQDLLDVLQRELDETKRSLSSLARAGELANRPALVAESLDGLPWEVNKRSLESLARTWNRPDHSKRSPPYGAFDLMESQYAPWGKRNAAALLRQTKFQTPDGSPVDESQRDDSDHQGGQGRRKRSLWDEDLYGEVASPYVQSSARGTAPGQEPDWEPMWSPSAWGAYFGYGEDTAAPPQQKRFLGRIPNMGRHRQKTNEDSSPRRRRPH